MNSKIKAIDGKQKEEAAHFNNKYCWVSDFLSCNQIPNMFFGQISSLKIITRLLRVQHKKQFLQATKSSDDQGKVAQANENIHSRASVVLSETESIHVSVRAAAQKHEMASNRSSDEPEDFQCLKQREKKT